MAPLYTTAVKARSGPPHGRAGRRSTGGLRGSFGRPTNVSVGHTPR